MRAIVEAVTGGREDFVGRIDDGYAEPEPEAALGSGERKAADPWGEKLAHRALGGTRCSTRAHTLSPRARDRLYERMFPKDICLGSTGHGKPDPLA